MNSRILNYPRILAITFNLFLSATGHAATESTEDPKVFKRTYAGIELARNFPLSTSEDELRPGHAHPVMGYRYFLDDAWIMGIFGGFRMLRSAANGHEVPILSIAHESSRLMRIYHPTYLASGFRVLYLMPATHGMLPTSRSKEFRTEFGLSLSATLIHLISPQKMLTMRIERWRGTGSTSYQGIEVAVGGSMSFD